MKLILNTSQLWLHPYQLKRNVENHCLSTLITYTEQNSWLQWIKLREIHRFSLLSFRYIISHPRYTRWWWFTLGSNGRFHNRVVICFSLYLFDDVWDSTNIHTFSSANIDRTSNNNNNNNNKARFFFFSSFCWCIDWTWRHRSSSFLALSLALFLYPNKIFDCIHLHAF